MLRPQMQICQLTLNEGNVVQAGSLAQERVVASAEKLLGICVGLDEGRERVNIFRTEGLLNGLWFCHFERSLDGQPVLWLVHQ